MSQARGSFAAMDDEQYWAQRLEEFLDYVRDTTNATDPTNAVANLRTVVSRWISHALEQEAYPGERNEELLSEWVTNVLVLDVRPQGDYRSRVGRWWNWCEANPGHPAQSPVSGELLADDSEEWLLALESYLHWRGWAGGSGGSGAQPETRKTVRSVVAGWIRWACDNGLDPSRDDESALASYLQTKHGTKSDTRRGYARHIRRWWKRLPLFVQARPERLARLVAEFRSEGFEGDGYPSQQDLLHQQVRAEYEQILRSLPDMEWEDREQVKAVWPMHPRGINFGGAGKGSGTVSKTVNDASAEQWIEIRSALWQLCFGQHEGDAERFDSALGGPVKGLAELVATRLLAICHPDKFLANFKLQVDDPEWPGTFQLAQLMSRLALLDGTAQSGVTELASLDLSSHVPGIAVTRTHALLVRTLEPHLSTDGAADTWGMRGFLYWLAQRFLDPDGSTDPVDKEDSNGEGLDLSTLVAEFRAAGYPDERDRLHLQAREQHERALRSLKEMAFEDRRDVKAVWAKSNQNYGWCGQQPSLDRAVNNATEGVWSRLRSSLAELCFGTDELADRIDDAVRSVSGLGYLAATKLPAVCHPEAFVPLYNLRRVSEEGQALGKLNMIELLAEVGLLDTNTEREAEAIIELHERRGDCGAAVMRSNKLLLELLARYFTGDGVVDTWGIARFLYWLAWKYREEESDELRVNETDLRLLADELLCDFETLDEIVKLLEDKRQVILYGPPGTGKTYFAQRLARTLTGIQDNEWYEEDGPYSLVQFHPAYSYEDFFEGFRPHVDDNGNMTYKLMPGPLVRLAECAVEHSGLVHVMVIDEINRANLPRVLGELLYLLEYRDEWTHTQYRPVDGFTLPSNLWIIGTMNTADRSIALIDAAMRRRFHFVPFFPNRPPTKGLLQRWTRRHAPDQTWVVELLDMVNGELEKALDGDHLLIGPSHFMKRGLDEAGVRRIWTYNIEPLIEDQLFGQHDAIERFRFDNVMLRHRRSADSGQDGDADAAEPVGDNPASADDGAAATSTLGAEMPASGGDFVGVEGAEANAEASPVDGVKPLGDEMGDG